MLARFWTLALAVVLFLVCMPLVAGAADGWERAKARVHLDTSYLQFTQAAQQGAGSGGKGSTQNSQVATEPAGGTFTDADEAARKSSNPLGGDFIILLNQFDNYFMQGDATSDTQHVNTWAIQPVIPIPMKNIIGENWI